MATLNVPSAQHLARNWASDSNNVKKNLVSLVLNPPIFNYFPLFSATRDMLLFNQPYRELEKGISRSVKQSGRREDFLRVLNLVQQHFDGIRPTFVQQVARRHYSVGRGLLVPFDTPMIYGVDGKLHFPWFSFWRSNPLDGERLSLFVTIVKEILDEDPDLELADFEILDFSANGSNSPRVLKIIKARDVPLINAVRKIEMLEIFAEGYIQAAQALSDIPKNKKDDNTENTFVPNQPRLF